jgi:hypothetical protein
MDTSTKRPTPRALAFARLNSTTIEEVAIVRWSWQMWRRRCAATFSGTYHTALTVDLLLFLVAVRLASDSFVFYCCLIAGSVTVAESKTRSLFIARRCGEYFLRRSTLGRASSLKHLSTLMVIDAHCFYFRTSMPCVLYLS